MGPFGALNPHAIWILVILVMAIGGVGYLAVRILGSRAGLPIAGLALGFRLLHRDHRRHGRARRGQPEYSRSHRRRRGAVNDSDHRLYGGGAAATSMATLKVLAMPLVLADIAALAYGALATLHVWRQKSGQHVEYGRAFSLKTALVFAVMVSAILVAAAALQQWYGANGVLAAAALAGFVDAQSAAISVAALVASGKLTAQEALFPIVLGLTTNTLSKMAVAAIAGGRAFALRVIPGLLLVIAAAWAGMAMT